MRRQFRRLQDLREEQAELNEDKKEELNEKLQELMAHAEEHLAVTVTYFKPDNRKEGGKYETVTGTFRKIRDYDKMFILENGTGIACDMIYELEVNGFLEINRFSATYPP